MKIKEPKAGSGELLPEGTYPAVLVEMLDLGRPRNLFDNVDGAPYCKTKPVFQLEEINDFDERYELSGFDGKPLNITWSKKGKWLPFITAVLGAGKVNKALENGEFDHTALENSCVFVTVAHVKRGKGVDAKTRLEVTNVSQFPKGIPPIAADGYVLQREREGYIAPIPGVFEEVMDDVISTAPTFLTFKGETYQPWGDYAPDVPRVWKKDEDIEDMPEWKGGEVAPALEEAPAPKPAPRQPREVDPRSTNKAPSPQQYAKDLAAGREPVGVKVNHAARQPEPAVVGADDDDVDVFADE